MSLKIDKIDNACKKKNDEKCDLLPFHAFFLSAFFRPRIFCNNPTFLGFLGEVSFSDFDSLVFFSTVSTFLVSFFSFSFFLGAAFFSFLAGCFFSAANSEPLTFLGRFKGAPRYSIMTMGALSP